MQHPSLLLGISWALICSLSSHILARYLGFHSALWALTIAGVYVAVNRNARLLPLLVVPLVILTLGSLLFCHGTIRYHLIVRLLVSGDGSVVNSQMIVLYPLIFAPLVVLMPSLEPITMLKDLERYGVFRIQPLAWPFLFLINLLLVVDLGKVLFQRIEAGLACRYIQLDGIFYKLKYLRFWSQPLLTGMLITTVQRQLYLDATGIRIQSLGVDQANDRGPAEVMSCLLLLLLLLLWLRS